MSNATDRKTLRNPVKVAMDLRYGRTTTTMRDRRNRREKDARKSWRNEDHG